MWPKSEPYLVSFPQTRAVRLADLTFSVSPAIAFVTLYFQYQLLGAEALNLSLAMALLILSLPLHGYFLLGQQAKQRLPLGLQGWYREIEQKLKAEAADSLASQQNVREGQKANSKLTYFDLAKLLKTLFERR